MPVKKSAADSEKTRRSKATVHDVAREAGVSIATVSRVLNKSGSVRPALRDKVVEAAQELGYTANSVGQALRTQRTHVIGTMLPRIDDPVFSMIADQVQESLLARGYVGFLQTVGFDSTQLFDHAMRMLERGAEGLLLMGLPMDDKLLSYVEKHQIPLLSLYSYSENSPLPSIGFDNAQATRQLLEMLSQFGHERIAVISGSTRGNDRQAARIEAYRVFMAERGLPPVVEMFDIAREHETGASALRRIRAAHPEVTAVLCNRDEVAFSVLAECRRQGIPVPAELSVAGFDDLEHAALFHPSLTTAAAPTRQISRHAAEAMMDFLDHGTPLESVRYDTKVVLRESTARPR